MNTSTTTRPTPTPETAESPESPESTHEPAGSPAQQREPLLGLSMSQLAGSAAAAATAAALGSRLGVIGTIVGAALISVVTAVAGALYTHSLRRTREAVARTAERLPTVRVPAQRRTTRRWHRVGWKPVVTAAVLVFVGAGAIVTGVEQLTGHSLDGTGRTSVGRVLGGDRSAARSVERSQHSTTTDRRSDGSGASGGSSSSSAQDSASGQGQDEGQDQQPSSAPTPSADPTDGSTSDPDTGAGTDNGGSGSPATELPTTEPSATTSGAAGH